MARTTPYSFYHAFVVPNLDDFLSEPDDIRRGFNASVSAFQMADVMYAYYKKHGPAKVEQWPDKGKLLKHLCQIEPYFLTIQSVATAYKHLYTRNRYFEYDIDSSGALTALTLPKSGIDVSPIWNGGDKRDVIVRRRDKTQVSLTDALEAVVDRLWPAVLPSET